MDSDKCPGYVIQICECSTSVYRFLKDFIPIPVTGQVNQETETHNRESYDLEIRIIFLTQELFH